MNGSLVFQLFKYSVYILLSFNIYVFFMEDHAAAQIRFPHGLSVLEILGAYAATIDTAAWVALILIFELETFVLEDQHFTPPVTALLRSIAAVSFLLIAFAFLGYLQTVTAMHKLSPAPDVTNLCEVADSGQNYAANEAQYEEITTENCADLTTSTSLFRFSESGALADRADVINIQHLAWADLINSAAWILVVLVLQLDVYLQERHRLHGKALHASIAAKGVLYPVLFLAAVYWGVKGELIDFWDAFLWLVAFLFIENNILQWRQEELAAQRAAVIDAN